MSVSPATDSISRLSALLRRKVWLSRELYVALPLIYLLLALIAIGEGMIAGSSHSWILAISLVLAAGCLHAFAMSVFHRLRRRWLEINHARPLPRPRLSPRC